MIDRRYWDSACFLAWFNEEPGRWEVCGSVLQAAEDGKIELVTSAFTITEVLQPKGEKPLSAEKRTLVQRFFRRPEFVIVNVDRRLAEHAQRYFWDFNIKPKDAIHVASAVYAGVPVLETFDEGLICHSGRLAGNPVLQVRVPEGIGGDLQENIFDDL